MEIIRREHFENNTMTVEKKQFPESRLQVSINSDQRIVLRFTQPVPEPFQKAAPIYGQPEPAPCVMKELLVNLTMKESMVLHEFLSWAIPATRGDRDDIPF